VFTIPLLDFPGCGRTNIAVGRILGLEQEQVGTERENVLGRCYLELLDAKKRMYVI
jgi:hypothetical protein